MGTRVGMEHIQKRPYVQLFTESSHTHKYPYMWCSHYKYVNLTASGIL